MAQALASPWRRVVALLGRAIVKYPIVFIIIVGLAIFSIAMKREADAREAFENSPAGQAQAQREQRAIENQVDIDVAKALVQARLRDPQSAEFVGVEVVQRGNQRGVCGFVNGRNGFGGMAGNEAFAVIGVTAYLASSGRAELDRIYHFCSGR